MLLSSFVGYSESTWQLTILTRLTVEDIMLNTLGINLDIYSKIKSDSPIEDRNIEHERDELPNHEFQFSTSMRKQRQKEREILREERRRRELERELPTTTSSFAEPDVLIDGPKRATSPILSSRDRINQRNSIAKERTLSRENSERVEKIFASIDSSDLEDSDFEERCVETMNLTTPRGTNNVMEDGVENGIQRLRIRTNLFPGESESP